ncbi:MAG: preprotein translocase subunit SecG [Thiohalomonadales bacterium]|nr:preprotein translocase subunit SecG [Thiohalomonadales bacterium]
MIYNIILAVFVVVSVALVALILIQQGKGAEAGAAFGSGASGTVFGARGSASFLTRATAILATLFFILSLTLAYLSNQQVKPASVLEKVQQQETPATQEVPAADIPATDKKPAAPASDVPASE